MATLISRSPEETVALGEQWGREAQRGWVIGLSGDLGAGKTQLVKGIARGLGSSARVHSPTFALLHEYGGGRLPLFHLDLYRLENRAQIDAAGLDDYLVRPHGVTVVEWIEKWAPFEVQGSRFKVQSFPLVTRLAWMEAVSESERRIVYEDSRA
jgi:tRNA threonylcarbamoyladenosine biosynthesis protein TsaE